MRHLGGLETWGLLDAVKPLRNRWIGAARGLAVVDWPEAMLCTIFFHNLGVLSQSHNLLTIWADFMGFGCCSLWELGAELA